MNVKPGLLLAIVGRVATAGVATAQPAASPSDVSSDERGGPPAELPGPVPDFVGDILDLIGQELSGALFGQGLGDALSSLLSSDGAGGATG
jgi:hypothetical protein